jgi:DNA-binding XRE family transcriptional regulator
MARISGYGARLKALRGDKSLDEVANATGLTRSAIFMYETEERIPRDENKVALAKYFGKSVQEIFFESECHDT